MFSYDAKAGANLNLFGGEIMASVASFNGEFEIPVYDETLIIGGEIDFLSLGRKANVDNGELEAGQRFILGGTVIIGFE